VKGGPERTMVGQKRDELVLIGVSPCQRERMENREDIWIKKLIKYKLRPYEKKRKATGYRKLDNSEREPRRDGVITLANQKGILQEPRGGTIL